jgi:hypothetical protein
VIMNKRQPRSLMSCWCCSWTKIRLNKLYFKVALLLITILMSRQTSINQSVSGNRNRNSFILDFLPSTNLTDHEESYACPIYLPMTINTMMLHADFFWIWKDLDF